MKFVKICFIKLAIIFLKLFYAVIKLFPTKNKITFISRQSNSPSLDFTYLANQFKLKYPNYQVVMLTKTLDNKFTYVFHMFRQMYHIATSKVVLLDSYCIVISVLKHKKRLKVIQMWHAVGSMKKFGYAMLGKEEGNDADIAKVMCMHKNYDHILISSKSSKASLLLSFINFLHFNQYLLIHILLFQVRFPLNKAIYVFQV